MRAGWYVQPQLSFRGGSPTIHLSLSAATAPLVDEFLDGLLAAVGMARGDGVALPAEMAEINALLDLAAPALREALLVAFLDRLSRPVRRPS